MTRRGTPTADLITDTAGKAALAAALAHDRNVADWRDFLSRTVHRDGTEIVESTSESSLSTLTQTPDWLLQPTELRLRHSPPHEQVLFETRFAIEDRLVRQLQARESDIPDSGFVLFLTEYLHRCLVLGYTISDGAASIKTLHALDEPEAIYDLFPLLPQLTGSKWSTIKRVIRSTTKLIAHRGVLCHVDRHSEPEVFGPSIDTVYLHEVLCLLLYEIVDSSSAPAPVTRALDVGCGNGLLTSALLTHMPTLSHLVAFDIESDAIRCTSRNLKTVRHMAPDARVHLIQGAFDSSLLVEKYDLIISNPPYLPVSPRNAVGRFHAGAITGTSLIRQLLKSARDILAPHGALLLVFSDVALEEFDHAQGALDGIEAHDLSALRGLRVSLDLDALHDDASWRDDIRKRRGVESSDSGKTLTHVIRVKGIVLKTTTHPEGSMADRVIRLSRHLHEDEVAT